MEDAPKAEGEADKKIVHVYPLVKVNKIEISKMPLHLFNSLVYQEVKNKERKKNWEN